MVDAADKRPADATAWVNAFVAGAVVLVELAIAAVFLSRCESQVGNSVIKAIAIDVIDHELARVLLVVQQPGNAMGQ